MGEVCFVMMMMNQSCLYLTNADSQGPNALLDKIAEQLEAIIQKSPVWGLAWSLLAILS